MAVTDLNSTHQFRASKTFTLWPGLLALLNVILAIILLAVHQIKAAPLFGTLGLAFLTLFVSAITLRITMDADGLGQRWLWGRRRIAWHEIASIERVRRGIAGVGLFLLDEKGKEIFAVSALPFTDQQVIVDAALRYGRLRKDKKPPKRPIMERWMRK
jgi:hypothetical protein